jgi:hypothetical protein
MLLSWNVVMSGAGLAVGGCEEPWTVVATVAVWDKVEDVPVKVMVPVALAAVEAAARVIFCGTAGVTLTVVGEAVTPAGSPETATETVPVKELTAVAEMVTSDPEAPACSVTEAGETESEKSGVGEDGGGEDVPEFSDFELPQDASVMTEQRRIRRLREDEPMPDRPLDIEK